MALGGLAYHVMNRVSGRQDLFEDSGDYGAFEKVMEQARERERMRICAYALMPNHFHLVLWPRERRIGFGARWPAERRSWTSKERCWMSGRWIGRGAGGGW
jgi:REP element-mobilizing transposase RayT